MALLAPPGGGDGRFFAVNPLRRLDGPSRAPADWTCLGSFELAMVPNGGNPVRGRAQVFAFVPAAPESEVSVPPCPGPVEHVALRGAGTGGNCPLPGPVEGGGGGNKAPRG